MPEGDARVEEFCLMLAKIAHSYTVAEMGFGKFKPLLLNSILHRDLSQRADFIGSLDYDEAPSKSIHEITLCGGPLNRPDLIVVRIRLLAKLGTPTYYVVAGYYS